MWCHALILGSLFIQGLITNPYSYGSNPEGLIKTLDTEISEINLGFRLIKHVEFLTSDFLEGRLTGSKGEHLATEYIAHQFQQLGLQPAGDKGTFFQEFDFVSGIKPGNNNTLKISQAQSTKELHLNTDWRPLTYSASRAFNCTELVFAGYGINAPASGHLPAYNSYQDINVKNKCVLVLENIPLPSSAARQQQLRHYSSIRYKTFTAKAQGARVIFFVPHSKHDQLIPLSNKTSLTSSGLIVLSVKRSVIEELLHTSLARLRVTGHSLLHGSTINGHTELVKEIQHGRNVLARLNRGFKSTSLLLIGAHADHLGRGELGGSRARSNEQGDIHPGADDNASGVAVVLETARTLAQMNKQGTLHGRKDILFAAWSGEEYGVLGSSYFMSQFKNNQNHPSIIAAINLDMVGHLQKHLIVQGTGSGSEWNSLLTHLGTINSLSLVLQSDPYLPTDTTSFYISGIPAINLFTGAHDEYHTPRDTSATLNFKGMQSITQWLVDLICHIETMPQTITYRKLAKPHHKETGELKIYLGTIPDYAHSDIKGVRLSGVASNSPAEKAGIQQGDIIVALAEKDINDIYDYTYVLNELSANKHTTITVKRANKTMQLTLIPKYRT